jgi:hypothetical protein
MWIFHLFYYGDIIQLDVEILVYRLQRSAYLDVILELDGDFMVDQSLEEAYYYEVSLCLGG